MATTLTRDLNLQIHNKFEIEVVDVETGEVKQKAQAFNTLCEGYFKSSRPGQEEPGTIQYLCYGTGTGTPSFSDTDLFNRISGEYYSKSYISQQLLLNIEEQFYVRTMLFRIESTEANGNNITEVGLVEGGYNDYLCSHAMLQDMNGNPISILKTNTDIINIYATLYLHINAPDILLLDGGEDSLGATLLYKSNPIYNILYYGYYTFLNKTYAIAVGYRGSDGADYYSPVVLSRQKIDNYHGIIKLRIDFNQNNIDGGIYGIYLGHWIRYFNSGDILILPNSNTIPKFHITNEIVGTGDGTTIKFKTKTDCPENAKVYINGVRTTNVTVKKDSVIAWNNNNTGSLGYHYYYRTSSLSVDFPADRGYNSSLQQSLPSSYTMTVCNQLYPLHGFISVDYCKSLKVSNDGITWVDIITEPGTASRTTLSNYYKYYKFSYYYDGNYYPTNVFQIDTHDGYNIIFDTPPAEGDVITIDYDTEYIPKDSDHVIDIDFNITVGEYQGS